MSVIRLVVDESFPMNPYRRLDVLMRTQVFTPSGRYGISIECYKEYGLMSYNTINVVDFAEMKLHIYKNVVDQYLKFDFHYCLNEFQLVVFHNEFDDGGFVQRIIQLDHQERTFKRIKSRIYANSVNASLGLWIHPNGLNATTIHYAGEDFLIWFTSETVIHRGFQDISKFFLLPKDPNSTTEIKMFLVHSWGLLDNNHEAIKYHAEKYTNQRVTSQMIPVIIEGKLCFAVGIHPNTIIINVYACLDLTKLVNVYGKENINMDELMKQQETAYSIISTPRGDGDIESVWPAYEVEFYSYGNTFYQWVKKPNANSETKVYNCGSTLIMNGKQQIIDFEYPKELSSFYYTIHPCGFRLRWSKVDNSIDLKIEDIGGPVGSLFNLAKKKLFLEDSIKNIKDPAVLDILWHKI